MINDILIENSALFYVSIFFLMYAETHYSFRGIYSRLKKNEPEIIADAPHRVEPGSPVPILILIKDAHLHPVILEEILIEIHGGILRSQKLFKYEETINRPLWHDIIRLDAPIENDELSLDVSIRLRHGQKIIEIKNDNYKCSSHAPLKIRIAHEGLPKTQNWHYGEFHCHTNFTDDQVEFGAPLSATKVMVGSADDCNDEAAAGALVNPAAQEVLGDGIVPGQLSLLDEPT